MTQVSVSETDDQMNDEVDTLVYSISGKAYLAPLEQVF